MHSTVISSDLFRRVLIDPALEGCTELHIVTGWTSPAMISRHVEALSRAGISGLEIDVTVGMSGAEGIPSFVLTGLQALPRNLKGVRINCSLALPGSSFNSKIYVWSKGSGPWKAWVGSANYTQIGFGLSEENERHKEVLAEVDPHSAWSEVLALCENTIAPSHPEIGSRLAISPIDSLGESSLIVKPKRSEGSVVLPLVQTKRNAGEVHPKSGLNWGQRAGRDQSQAYLPIPSEVRSANFFPPIGEHFQVVSTDGESFICTVAQAGGKALHTPIDNSQFGLYFRRRLGLEDDAFVSTQDLERFGSNGVEFSRVSEGLYTMHFEPGIKAI